MLFVTSCLIAALILDYLLGEPKRFHPLVGFGRFSIALENILHCNPNASNAQIFIRGIIAWSLAVLPITAMLVWLDSWLTQQHLLLIILLNSAGFYFCIGAKSLEQHAINIFNPLRENHLALARYHLSHIVSRDTALLDQQQITKATMESVLENGNDGIFAAIFWFVIGGLPAAVTYRLVNTLDAMWGYRSERYLYFGKFAAHMDDIMNFIPARLTAFSYCLMGHFRSGWYCWHTQGKYWKSPNAGPVMAAGAGALQIKLGGLAIYKGISKTRPTLGCNQEVSITDIHRALMLIQKTLWLWVMCIFLLELLYVCNR